MYDCSNETPILHIHQSEFLYIAHGGVTMPQSKCMNQNGWGAHGSARGGSE
jgi:hypothetical protein